MKKIKILLSIMTIFLVTEVYSQAIDVDVNFNVKHTVGGESEFDRSRFITVHSDQTDGDWNGTNFTPDLLDNFMNGLDVHFGRSTGAISFNLSQVAQDPARPGYASLINLQSRANSFKNSYNNNTRLHAYEARNQNYIIGAQLHPFWPDGTLTRGGGWALSMADTPTEPFGTATGEYMGHFTNEFFSKNSSEIGQPIPKFIEVVNEPLYELVTLGSTPPREIFEFHNAVADQIKAIVPDIKVCGYTVAFPDFEKNNFRQWEERDKLFMDIAGNKMDVWSIHLYDFASINGGKKMLRSGSNVEATFDMMDHYSTLLFNEVKPYIVSEYGSRAHDLERQGWSAYRDWLQMKGFSSLLMSFLERPDKIEMTIPFVVLKAEWGRNATTGTPYPWRLMRQKKEEPGGTGDEWVYTEEVKFYELWSDVNGTRIDTKSTDLDIQMDAYVDGNKAYVILNNLYFSDKTLKLNLFDETVNPITNINVKHLHLAPGNIPTLDNSDFTSLSQVDIGAEGTIVLEYTFQNAVTINETSDEVKYFADKYYRPIVANVSEIFTVNNVTTGAFGETVLRIGLGRDHNRSLSPQITFNGTTIDVPTNWRGYDQKDRGRFFGVLEIPVPYNLLQASNTVSVTFNDTSGHISSVALQTFEFSKKIIRSDDILSVNEVNTLNNDVKLFPNPSNGEFNLILPKGIDQGSITIYSLSGAILLEKDITDNSTNINIKDKLPSGMYFVTGKTNGTAFYKALMIE